MNNQHYKSILNHQTTAVILLNAELCLTFLNPAAEVLLELSFPRVNGQRISRLLKEENPKQQQELANALNSGSPFTKRRVSIHLPSLRNITVDYSATPISQDGEQLLLIEVQPLDRLLRISREETLLSSQQTTQTLVRGLAHEIKNPLGGLRGAAQLLERCLEDPSLTDYTQIIIEEADRLSNLVDQLLGPNSAPTMQPTNIHEVLERVYTLVDVENNGKVLIERDYDPSFPDIQGDKALLIQVFLNIIRNAVQAVNSIHTDDGVITLRTRSQRQFTIGNKRHRVVLRVDVIDNGPGIPPELIDNIFLPMVTGRAEGTGLGLSIAQSIINQHQGLIACTTEPGKTRFTIYIPLELDQ